MLLNEEREAIVSYGRKLITSHLTTGSGGNLCLFNRAENLLAIKPSGVDYFEMRPEDVVVLSPDGRVVEGVKKPSSEVNFHLALFQHRPEINAVVHTHSVYATTIACLNWELPAVHYLVAYSGGKVPLAAYATFGTKELADNILQAIGSYNACLLANHGLVAVGRDLSSAFTVAEEIELVAQIFYQARCIGQPVILPEDEMKRVGEEFKTYGQA